MSVTNKQRNPLHVITYKSKVRINILDINDNCPVFINSSRLEVSVTSPIAANRVIAYVETHDKDSYKNRSFSLTSQLFSIDDGFIRSRKVIKSLVEEFHMLTVKVSDGKCTVTTKVGVRIKVSPNPKTYMFTSNGLYVVDVAEDNGLVNKILTVAINGVYNHQFSIVEASENDQFIISPTTGINCYFTYFIF